MAGIGRRTFVGLLIAGLTFAGLGRYLPARKYGRVNVQEHGGWWRAWLDGHEVSADCYEADDCVGYVKLLCKDGRGKPYYDSDIDDVAREIRFGDVRIERIERA